MVETQTEYDTIAAISTPPGEGAISIVRLSGEDSLKIISKMFKGKDLNKVPTHTINYGHIIDPKTKEVVDEVMVTVMRAPKTYTREDIVEINCHGGIVPTNNILQLLLANGARMANPGEFTERAFLHGRIDLTQAESVLDVIKAKTDRSAQLALKYLGGSLGKLIHKLREEILDTLSKVEVNIDYPEYDGTEMITAQLLKERTLKVKAKIDKLLETAQGGKILREGLATAIVGRPNVGKSSLLNYLLHEDKAIVTDVAGTTRDVIEEYVNIKGIPLKLIDTAGIHETNDKVEKIGVERSRRAIDQGDLVILVIDASESLTTEDRLLINLTKGKQRIVILNKIDLQQKIELDEIENLVGSENIIQTSIINDIGVDELEEQIKKMFASGIESSQNSVIINNARHVALLNKAANSLEAVLTGIKNGMPVDLCQTDMRDAWEDLGEITGDSYNDELLDELFSRFCLGK